MQTGVAVEFIGMESPNQVFEMEDANFSDSELVYHVKDALKSALVGEVNSYDQLIGLLHHTENLQPDEVALLETSLRALSGAVSCIDIAHHERLLTSIFSMSMWSYASHNVMDALVELIVSLAISNGKFVDRSLDMLVRNFMPPRNFLDWLKKPGGIERKYQVTFRIHAALEKITEYVPLAPLRLLPIILQRMPTVYQKDHTMVIYVENMLKLEGSEVGKLVGGTLLMAVVDRLIDLDVEIGWDDILKEDFSKGIFEMEIEDFDEDIDDTEEDCDEFPLSRKSLTGNMVADLLDTLIVTTFTHLEYCKDAGRLVEVFETLLQSFQVTVLNAYKSKFAQFVMFYACALDPENCGSRFAMVLADIFVNDLLPELTRMSAVSYLASYLARGKFLSPSLVASILGRLVVWCQEYCETHDGDVINPKAHRKFYSGCQAIMYVLCFRMRSLMDVPRLKSQLHTPLETIFRHKLSPLTVCLPSVVYEFLRQAKATRLFTVSRIFVFDDLLESELSRAFGGLERLDMFFPFDPCLLRKSDGIIRGNFVFWSTVRPKYDEEGSDEDDDEDLVDENEDVLENRIAGSFDEGLDLDECGYALTKMSFTPKEDYPIYKFGDHFQEHSRMPSKIRPSMSP